MKVPSAIRNPMQENQYTIVVFIDYDNLLPTHKNAGVLDTAIQAISQIDIDASISKIDCTVRVYGGWYEGDVITRQAEIINLDIDKSFPTYYMYLNSEGKRIRTHMHAELAYALLQEPGKHMFHTYRPKGRPNNVKVANPADVGCTDSDCFLRAIKYYLKKGKCPREKCDLGDGLIYRSEQKLVDTMLSCDIIHAANIIADQVILISNDDDFIPPLRTAVLSGKPVARFRTRSNQQQNSYYSDMFLIEKDL